MRLPRWAPVAAAVAAATLVAALAGGPGGEGAPLDPTSTGPLGTKALVDVLRELGAEVDVERGLPDVGTTAVLVLADRFNDRDRFVLDLWVEDGGTLVMADPSSPLLEDLGVRDVESFFVPGVEQALGGPCPLAALASVQRLEAIDIVLFPVPDGAVGCYGDGAESYVVAVRRGRGTVVALGGAGALVNQQLGQADNAVLAAALLAPRPGARVQVARPPLPGDGDEGLLDLVPGRAWAVLAQLGLAFLVVVAWRARRLGRPVVERQPVVLEGSELVAAVGRLLHRARGRARAAEAVRADLARHLSLHLGVPPGMPAEELAAVAAARTGVAEDRLRAALAGPPPADEEGLVALAQAVESIRTEVTGARQGG